MFLVTNEVLRIWFMRIFARLKKTHQPRTGCRILVYLALILQIFVKKGGICWCYHKLGWWWGMVKAMKLGKATILLQRYIPTHQLPHPHTQPCVIFGIGYWFTLHYQCKFLSKKGGSVGVATSLDDDEEWWKRWTLAKPLFCYNIQSYISQVLKTLTLYCGTQNLLCVQ